jgi:hypothetical protein
VIQAAFIAAENYGKGLTTSWLFELALSPRESSQKKISPRPPANHDGEHMAKAVTMPARTFKK